MAAQNDPPEWNPTQPLPDKDDEAEAQSQASRLARRDWLKSEYDKKRPPEKKQKKTVW